MIHRTAIAAAALLALAPAARAFDIDTPDSNLKVRLDLTPKYSAGYRLKNPSAALTRLDVAVDPGTVNEDDGDHNFRRGLISNRLDLLAELDVSAKNFGGRISANAWRDSLYLNRKDYASTPLLAGGTALGPVVSTSNNNPGQDPNEFLPSTRRRHGQGNVVLMTGLTLALAVGTWVASPIKFQADMGILLAFMFVWNMVGALVLLPALAHFLLRPTAQIAPAGISPRTVHAG
jgi:hypothetical protein